MATLEEMRALVRDHHKRTDASLLIQAVVEDSSDLGTNKVRVYRLDIRKNVIVNGFKWPVGLYVWLKELPNKELQIIYVDVAQSTQVYGEGVAAATLPPTGHEAAPWSIPAQGYVPGRLEASQLGGLFVHVRSFWYDDQFYDGDALDPVSGLPTLNDFSLSGYTPASADFANWVPIWFDPADASIGKAANAATFGTANQLSEAVIDMTVVPPGCYFLGAVGLAYGQTTIDTLSRVDDTRLHLARHQTGGWWVVSDSATVPVGATGVIPHGIRVASGGTLTISGTLYVV